MHTITRMARWSARVAAIVTLGGAVACGALAATAAAKPPAQITFRSVEAAFRPFSKGFEVLDVDTTTSGATIGADTLICLKASPECTYTVDLGGNDLFLHTKQMGNGASGTIIGGTGRYQGATGTLVATNPTMKVTVVTIHFS